MSENPALGLVQNLSPDTIRSFFHAKSGAFVPKMWFSESTPPFACTKALGD